MNEISSGEATPLSRLSASQTFRALPPKVATGTTGSRYASLKDLNTLHAAHGTDVFTAALERAVAFGRFRAADVRSIIAAGAGVPQPTRPGGALIVPLPAVATRPLTDYAIRERA